MGRGGGDCVYIGSLIDWGVQFLRPFYLAYQVKALPLYQYLCFSTLELVDVYSCIDGEAHWIQGHILAFMGFSTLIFTKILLVEPYTDTNLHLCIIPWFP